MAHAPSLSLLHGHRYVTQVTCVNNAGGVSANVSAPVMIDVTGPAGGWVVDGDDGVDHDYGDAHLGSLAVSWGGWTDSESGVARVEWAVMAIDPRANAPIGAAIPGALLRNALSSYLSQNNVTLAVPERIYGIGMASRLYEVDAGMYVRRHARTDAACGPPHDSTCVQPVCASRDRVLAHIHFPCVPPHSAYGVPPCGSAHSINA